MSNPVLCIIDVQPKFSAAEAVVPACVALIAKFRRSGSPIFLVEYGGYEPSWESLYKAAKGYGKLYRVIKNGDNGSKEIFAAAAQNQISLNRIVICGVNACCCVHDTAVGLTLKVPCTIVPAKKALACACTWHCGSGGYSTGGSNCITYLINEIEVAKRERARLSAGL